MTRYVRNDFGAIHSVSDDDFENRLSVPLRSGKVTLLPGWEEVDEETARKEHPQLFGVPDPQVRAGLTALELADEVRRREMLDSLGSD